MEMSGVTCQMDDSSTTVKNNIKLCNYCAIYMLIFLFLTGPAIENKDLGGNVAAHRRESLHAPGPAVRPGGQAEVGEGDREEPLKGQDIGR